MKQVTDFLVSVFGTSWRSTLLGYVVAIITVVYPITQKGTFNIKTDWPSMVIAVVAVLAGNTLKDAKVSGLPDGTYNAPVVPPPPPTKLELAQASLEVAKMTKDAGLIQIAQAAVDLLTLAPQTANA